MVNIAGVIFLLLIIPYSEERIPTNYNSNTTRGMDINISRPLPVLSTDKLATQFDSSIFGWLVLLVGIISLCCFNTMLLLGWITLWQWNGNDQHPYNGPPNSAATRLVNANKTKHYCSVYETD